jgi:hypothetical protein
LHKRWFTTIDAGLNKKFPERGTFFLSRLSLPQMFLTTFFRDHLVNTLNKGDQYTGQEQYSERQQTGPGHHSRLGTEFFEKQSFNNFTGQQNHFSWIIL